MTPEIEKALAALQAAISKALSDAESRHADTASRLQQVAALLNVEPPKQRRRRRTKAGMGKS